jgi:hypothetical protein
MHPLTGFVPEQVPEKRHAVFQQDPAKNKALQ